LQKNLSVKKLHEKFSEKISAKKRIKNFAGTKMILQKKFQREKNCMKNSAEKFPRKKRIKNFSGTKINLQKKFQREKLHKKFSRKISAEKNESKIFLKQK
jgi:hypothetical protein